MYKALAALLLLWCVPGCEGRQPTRYRIHVHCQLPDGKPVAGVGVAKTAGAKPLLSSDAQGNIYLPVDGREGQEVQFAIVQLPPTLVLAEGADSRRVILKNFGVSGKQKVSDIEHEIRLRPKKETYVVLVSAVQAPMMPIVANGTVVAHLNSRSAAAFRTEGKPGEELKVSISASKAAKVAGTDPQQTFILPENSSILSFHSNLLLKPPPRPRAPKPATLVIKTHL